MGGVEAIRGIAFLVRDQNWGTYIPELSHLVIDRDDEQFRVSYDAVCADDHQRLSYTAVIEDEITVSDATALGAIAIDTAAGLEIWIANLGAEPQIVDLESAAAPTRMSMLSTDSFVQSCSGPDGLASTDRPWKAQP